MLASDFQAKLRKCNPKLRIFAGNDDRKAAGVYHVVNGEFEPIVGVDKNYLPEWSEVDDKGHILRGGWRRALRVLIGQGLIDRRRAEKVFGTHDILSRQPTLLTPPSYVDPIQKELEAAQMRSFVKTGKPALSRDEVMDLAKEISKNEHQPNNQ